MHFLQIRHWADWVHGFMRLVTSFDHHRAKQKSNQARFFYSTLTFRFYVSTTRKETKALFLNYFAFKFSII